MYIAGHLVSLLFIFFRRTNILARYTHVQIQRERERRERVCDPYVMLPRFPRLIDAIANHLERNVYEELLSYAIILDGYLGRSEEPLDLWFPIFQAYLKIDGVRFDSH